MTDAFTPIPPKTSAYDEWLANPANATDPNATTNWSQGFGACWYDSPAALWASDSAAFDIYAANIIARWKLRVGTTNMLDPNVNPFKANTAGLNLFDSHHFDVTILADLALSPHGSAAMSQEAAKLAFDFIFAYWISNAQPFFGTGGSDPEHPYGDSSRVAGWIFKALANALRLRNFTKNPKAVIDAVVAITATHIGFVKKAWPIVAPADGKHLPVPFIPVFAHGIFAEGAWELFEEIREATGKSLVQLRQFAIDALAICQQAFRGSFCYYDLPWIDGKVQPDAEWSPEVAVVMAKTKQFSAGQTHAWCARPLIRLEQLTGSTSPMLAWQRDRARAAWGADPHPWQVVRWFGGLLS